MLGVFVEKRKEQMMRSRDEQREERRRYEGDVSYDVWRNGGNPDQVDYERVTDGYYGGLQAEDVAREELRRQRPRPVPEEHQYPEEQFPDEADA